MNCILFYSNKCDSCKSFIQIINNEKLTDIFKCICVDKLPVDKLLKMKIKNVPTIIIKGQNGSSSMFECINAFTWLDNLLKHRRQTIRTNDIQIENMIDGYKKEEFNGISDQYAYLHTDNAQPKSFLPYGKDDQYRILTIPTNNSNNKLDTKDQTELINKLENIRNKQTGDIRVSMEKNQLDIINKHL